jgi:hypothetical protein
LARTRTRLLKRVLIVTILAVVAACPGCGRSTVTPATKASEQTPLPTATVEVSPVAPTTPAIEVPPPRESGLASLGGTLVTIYGDGPIPGTVFYLTRAIDDNGARPPSVLSGYHADRGDVRGTSGDHGELVLDAVPPGRYYLAVWAPYNWILAVESETDDTPRLIEVEAGQRLDLGRVDVPWP